MWVLLASCVERGMKFPDSYAEVTVGDGFTCAAIADNEGGYLDCWGRDVRAAHPPTPELGPGMIRAGGLHACGLDRERGVVCWGEPDDPVVSQIPAVRAPDVAVSPTHACVLDIGTIPRCWGQSPGAPPPELHAFVIAPGLGHTCVLEFATHEPVCWGANTMGQATPPALRLLQLVAGDGFTCGMPAMGPVTCWGRSLPSMPAPGTMFRTIVAGPTYACGDDDAGVLTCWGEGPADLLTPPPIPLQRASLGRSHACGITIGDVQELVCWGDNSFGQLDVPPLH